MRGRNDGDDEEDDPESGEQCEGLQQNSFGALGFHEFIRDRISATDAVADAVADANIHVMKEDKEVQQTCVDERRRTRKRQITRNLILIGLCAASILGAGIALRIVVPA